MGGMGRRGWVRRYVEPLGDVNHGSASHLPIRPIRPLTPIRLYASRYRGVSNGGTPCASE